MKKLFGNKYKFYLIAMGLLGAQFGFAEKTKASDDWQLPVKCKIGDNCFLQNLVDMDTSQKVHDTLCQGATYDGHKGIDIRVKTTEVMDRGVTVVAAADGVVLGTRDGMDDVLVKGRELPEAIKGRECGNGLAIRHSGGLVSQYCHMKRGTVAFKKGDRVKQGEAVGQIGLSGHTQFPHLHFTVRREGEVIDPLSGKVPRSDFCPSDLSFQDSFFSQPVTDALIQSRNVIFDVGLSGEIPDLDQMVFGKKPKVASVDLPITIGWVWVINLEKGDTIRSVIRTQDGAVFSQSQSEPQDRHKAQYFHYSGKKRPATPGTYTMDVSIIRDGSIVRSRSQEFKIN